jgi:nitroimidazol reductase NimA-like FMN-containing flavoprotein (pyridoxamine 5'-phosphate oxidase superfamily)
MSEFTPTERTKVQRKPDRATYDRELIYSILDEAFVCQIAFVVDAMPYVVPTNYVRVGDKLFLHGSTAGRLMRALASGASFCLSVTLLDGIVLSPTATGHSVNYRSVVVMGKAEQITDPQAKLAAMRDFVEYVIRGRWAQVRPPKFPPKSAPVSPWMMTKNIPAERGRVSSPSNGVRKLLCLIRAVTKPPSFPQMWRTTPGRNSVRSLFGNKP